MAQGREVLPGLSRTCAQPGVRYKVWSQEAVRSFGVTHFPFRLVNADGKVYGERKLLHDHAGEQPFTRDLYGVTIPPHVNSVVIQARDQKYGYGGKTLKISLPGR